MKKPYDIERARRYMEAQEAFFAEHFDSGRAAMIELLPEDMTGLNVLDAGCGYGKDVREYTRCGAYAVGIDASDAMIALAQDSNPDLEHRFWVKTFDKTGFESDFFDLITSRYALQHELQMNPAYREFHRILAPGGEMIILVAHPLQTFSAKGMTRYHQQEEVDVEIYGTETDPGVVVSDHSHTLSDYLTQFVLSHFVLEHFEEQSPEHERESMFSDVPSWMLMKWRKKG